MIGSLDKLGLSVRALLFGGIADKFRPSVHKSWWSVMETIKEKMKELSKSSNVVSYFVLNISSVICPHELLTRPFVFKNTNADASFWLMPHEVADQVATLVFSKQEGFIEDEIFHKANYYEEDYFSEDKFVSRKKSELWG